MRWEIVYTIPGDHEREFDQFFRTTYPNLLAYLEKISGTRHQAEDLAQEVYMKAWEKKEQLPADERERLHYLLVMGRNHFINQLRSEERHKKHLAQFTQTSTPALSSDRIEYREQEAIIEKAIAEQQEEARKYYLLNREQGLTYREIARQEGISEKTVERYIGRVLRTLKTRLTTLFFW